MAGDEDAERDRELAIRMYTETRLPVAEIAATVRVSRQTVQNWVRAAGVPQRGSSGPYKGDQEDEEPSDRPRTQYSGVGVEMLHRQSAIEHDLNNLTRLVVEQGQQVARLIGAVETVLRLRPLDES